MTLDPEIEVARVVGDPCDGLLAGQDAGVVEPEAGSGGSGCPTGIVQVAVDCRRGCRGPDRQLAARPRTRRQRHGGALPEGGGDKGIAARLRSSRSLGSYPLVWLAKAQRGSEAEDPLGDLPACPVVAVEAPTVGYLHGAFEGLHSGLITPGSRPCGGAAQAPTEVERIEHLGQEAIRLLSLAPDGRLS